jgi:hypothetical protein
MAVCAIRSSEPALLLPSMSVQYFSPRNDSGPLRTCYHQFRQNA